MIPAHYVHIAIDQSNHSRWPRMWDKKHKHQNIKSCTLHSILITYFGLDTLVMNIKLFLTVLSVCKIWAKGVTITSSCLTTKPKPLLPTILCYGSQIIYGHKSWLVLINIFFVSSAHQTKNYSTFWLLSSYSYISLQGCGKILVALGLLCVSITLLLLKGFKVHTHDPQNFVCFFKQVLSKEGASNFVQEDSSLRVMKIFSNCSVWVIFVIKTLALNSSI